MTPQQQSIALYKLAALPCAKSSWLCYHIHTGSTATDIFETPPTPATTYHQAFSHWPGNCYTSRPNPSLRKGRNSNQSIAGKLVSYDLQSFRDELKACAPSSTCRPTMNVLGRQSEFAFLTPDLPNSPCLHGAADLAFTCDPASEIPERPMKFTAFVSTHIMPDTV